MQICTLTQTHDHASIPPLSFLQAGCSSCHPTNSVNAPKAFFTLSFAKYYSLSLICAYSVSTVYILCYMFCQKYGQQTSVASAVCEHTYLPNQNIHNLGAARLTSVSSKSRKITLDIEKRQLQNNTSDSEMELRAVSSAVFIVLLASFTFSFAASSGCAHNNNSNRAIIEKRFCPTVPHSDELNQTLLLSDVHLANSSKQCHA